MEIYAGTCGYGYYDPGNGWQEQFESKLAAFAADFPLVELNKTFYQLPQVQTTSRWREEAGEDFRFTLKAWQAITHPKSSPTWNNYRDSLPDDEQIGFFRPTQPVFDAWEATRERANALSADVCVFQTPPSFDYSETHVENIHAFFAEIEAGDLTLAWEPRGDWNENPAVLKELCSTHDLIHVVDLFRETPVTEKDAGYLRLHGLNEDPYDYDYSYSDEELRDLLEHIENTFSDSATIYCLFNNFQMYDDVPRFQQLLAETE